MLYNKNRQMAAVTLFLRQVSTLCASGVPVKEALLTLASENESKDVETMVNTILSDIDGETSSGNKFSGYPKYLKRLFGYFIDENPNDSEFADFLSSFADDTEKLEMMKQKAISILFYPISVLAISCIIVGVIMVFVIPTFEEMFSSFGSSLPLPTLYTIKISSFVSDWFLLLLAAVIVFIILLAVNRKLLYLLLNRIPGIGGFLKTVAIIQFLKYLSLLLTIKVPVNEAVDDASDAVINVVYAEKLNNLKHSVQSNEALIQALSQSGLFSPMAIRMIHSGDKAGTLEKTLREVAGYYDIRSVSIERFIQTVDLLLLIILGIVIGGFIVSMYMPIFQMAGAVG